MESLTLVESITAILMYSTFSKGYHNIFLIKRHVVTRQRLQLLLISLREKNQTFLHKVLTKHLSDAALYHSINVNT